MRFSQVKTIRIPKGAANEIRHNGKVLWNHIRARYVSLGDSIAAGQSIRSDAQYQHPACLRWQYGTNSNTETKIVPGTYTDLFRDGLAQKYNGTINATSFARSGDRVDDLMEKLDHDAVRNAIAKADYVTVCIGANDVLEPAMSHFDEYVNGDMSAMLTEIEGNLARLANDADANSYTALLNKLYGINPNAEYLFTTVYNPYKYLWLDDKSNGFFKPILDVIPEMNIDADGAVEDAFNIDDLGYYDILNFKWVSIDLDFDADQAIKDGLLSTPAVRMLFDRVNGLCDYAEDFVTRLNSVIKSKVSAFGKANFKVADSKAIFDTYPDRPIPADKHYNDLVNMEFTRGYDISEMDWGALWGSDPSKFWWDLVWDHFDVKGYDEINWTNLSWDVDDYVTFDLNGLAADLVDMIINRVIVPDADPHPEEHGHIALKQAFEGALEV